MQLRLLVQQHQLLSVLFRQAHKWFSHGLLPLQLVDHQLLGTALKRVQTVDLYGQHWFLTLHQPQRLTQQLR
jgi:hypothetical protein